MKEQCLTCNNNARRGNYYCSSACCRNDSKPSASPYLLLLPQALNTKPMTYDYYIHPAFWSPTTQAAMSNGYLFNVSSSRRSPCFD